jgi:hypothetical protein
MRAKKPTETDRARLFPHAAESNGFAQNTPFSKRLTGFIRSIQRRSALD